MYQHPVNHVIEETRDHFIASFIIDEFIIDEFIIDEFIIDEIIC